MVLILAGPVLIRVLFGAHAVLPRAGFGWLSLGVLAYLFALVLGQGAQAQTRHTGQVLAWLARRLACWPRSRWGQGRR